MIPLLADMRRVHALQKLWKLVIEQSPEVVKLVRGKFLSSVKLYRLLYYWCDVNHVKLSVTSCAYSARLAQELLKFTIGH
jgi:hypothetical protein